MHRILYKALPLIGTSSLAVILIILCCNTFIYSMHPLGNNEHMYVAAGVRLMQGGSLYADFAYVQMPYLPLLLSGIYTLTRTAHFFFTAKLLSYAACLAAAGMLYLISRRALGTSRPAALGAALLFLSNVSILNITSEVSNYIIPVCCIFAGFYLFVTSVTRLSKTGIFLSGICIAVATGVKLYYAPLALPFMVTACLFPRSSGFKQRLIRVQLPLCAGMLIGIAPALYYLLRDPELFYLNNMGFHLLKTQVLQLTQSTKSMTLHAKLSYTKAVLQRPDTIVLVIGILTPVLYALRRRTTSKRARPVLPLAGVLAALLLGVAGIVSLQPTPLYEQYLAMPISLALVCLIVFFAWLDTSRSAFPRALFAVLVLLCVVSRGSYPVTSILSARPADWAAVYAHEHARQIAARVAGPGGRVATLAPVYALEAGLPIYNELATGPFLYQVGSAMPAGQLRRMNGTAPDDLGRLFQKDPPRAILLEHGHGDEKPLRQYAEAHRYQKHDLGRTILYVNSAEDMQ
jgi:hypothetical protein